jgi:hypothetical protein
MKKSKSNREKIWKVQKVIWNVKWYGKYGRKISWRVKRYGKCGRKIGWIVKSLENTEEK